MWYVIIDLSKIKKQSEVFIMTKKEKNQFKRGIKNMIKTSAQKDTLWTYAEDNHIYVCNGYIIVNVDLQLFNELTEDIIFNNESDYHHITLIKELSTKEHLWKTDFLIHDDANGTYTRVFGYDGDKKGVIYINDLFLEIVSDFGYSTWYATMERPKTPIGELNKWVILPINAQKYDIKLQHLKETVLK
jgi:hypothetical protein